MMWDRVAKAWVALLVGDAALLAALGGPHVYPASAARVIRIPSIDYQGFSDIELETFNPIQIQVDYFARGVGNAATIERRIRTLTHRDVRRTLGGLRLWTRYLDSRNHDYPTDAGVVHRSLDFLFEPLRAKYAPAV